MFVFVLLILLIIGFCVGSFLNVVIFRLKNKKSLVFGRSECLFCKHKLSLFDLVPVLNFIFLKGKCRYCQKKISWQYVSVELATAFAFVFLFWFSFPQIIAGFSLVTIIEFLRNIILFCFLLVIFVYDLKYMLILDKVAIPGCIVIFFINFLLIILKHESYLNILYLLLAGIIGGGFFLLQFVISKGKWIGGGDIRLGFLAGISLGWPKILLCLVLTYFIGGFVASLLLLTGKKNFGSKLPLGTFMSAAILISLLWGDKIIEFYLNNFIL